MARKGLGKGLASLIPDFYNEDFDSNSPQSLEDMLNDEQDIEENEEVSTSQEEESDKNIFDEVRQDKESDEEIEEENDEEKEVEVVDNDGSQETEEDESPSEDSDSDDNSQESVQTSQEIKIQEEHIAEVKKIVDKNPRITLWSSRSSAVFRYLRKTEPEFSISKEASVLIEEAVAKKYPEIWALFEDY